MLKVKKIEDIVIAIIPHGHKTETRFYVPQGLNGEKFSSFKVRNEKLIQQLKDGGLDGNEIIKITPQESKYISSHNLFVQQEPCINVQDHILATSHKFARRRAASNRKLSGK